MGHHDFDAGRRGGVSFHQDHQMRLERMRDFGFVQPHHMYQARGCVSAYERMYNAQFPPVAGGLPGQRGASWDDRRFFGRVLYQSQFPDYRPQWPERRFYDHQPNFGWQQPRHNHMSNGERVGVAIGAGIVAGVGTALILNAFDRI